jgi:hypothetical protein
LNQQTTTTGPFWDEVASLMTAAGLNDSEYLRKGIHGLLIARNIEGLMNWLWLSEAQAEELLTKWDLAQPRRKTLDPIDESEAA